MDRIIADYMQRQWRIYAAVAGVALLLWAQLGLAHPLLSLPQTLADTMCLACFAGPIIAIMHWPSREYAVLPLSARDLWRARWLVAVALPSSAVMLGAGAAVAGARIFGGAARAGAEPLALAGVMSFAMCGVIFGTAPLIAMATSSQQGPWRNVKITAVVTIMLAIVSAPLVPPFFASYIPTAWSGFSPAWTVSLIAALGWSVSGYVRTVRLVIGGNRVPDRAKGRRAADVAPPRLDQRLSGLSGLIVKGAFGPIGMIATFALMQFILGEKGFTTDNSTSMFISATVIYWSWWPGPNQTQLRLLRVLPMSTNRLNMTLLAPSVIGWIVAWVLLLVRELFLGRSTVALRLDFFGLLLGFSALGIACQLRWTWGRAVGLLVIVAGVIADRRLGIHFTAAPLDISAGLAMLAVAWFLNAHTLSRTSAIYRRAPSNWGFASQQSNR